MPLNIFLERLTDVSALAEQVLITISDDDNALNAAHTYMGGQVRTGTQAAEIEEEKFIIREHLSNVQIMDVSFGQEVRGFDITSHHYWYRHPWTSSDMIFLMRTDLPPARRGLTPTKTEGVWYLSPDYPQRIIEAALVELEGQW